MVFLQRLVEHTGFRTQRNFGFLKNRRFLKYPLAECHTLQIPGLISRRSSEITWILNLPLFNMSSYSLLSHLSDD